MKKLSSFVIFILLLAGCRYSRVIGLNDNKLNEQMSLPKEEQLKLSYSLLNQKVFQPKCVSCHGNSGGVNLETYSDVVKVLPDIKRSVFITLTMPKQKILTDEEKRLLWNWIQLDGPMQAQNPATEPLLPEPVEATYESINKNILIPKCVTCHSEGNSGERILLTRSELLDSPLELVLPGNPDESGLVIAVERADRKRMPPEKDGYSALKDDEKSAIRSWIELGAP